MDAANDPEFGDEVRDRVMRVVRDHIISKNLTIRGCFDIRAFSIEVMVKPYFIKRKLKDICGSDATFKEIDWLIRTLLAKTQ